MIKNLKNILCIATLCVMVTGCIYPFSPEIDSVDQPHVVVEGDILVGEISQFKFSYTQSLYNSFDYGLDYYLKVSLYVESSNGDCYQGQKINPNEYSVDTRDLDKDLKYRLHFELNGMNYYSEWSEVLRATPIDEVSTYPDEEDGKVHVLVSTHADMNSPYVKWYYTEDYEYHSHFTASVYPDFSSMSVKKYGLNEPNHHICYLSGKSSGIMMYNTEDLIGNQLIDYDLYSIDREDRRVSHLYRSNVFQIALSKEAYIYWKTIRQNSQDMGNLFSPQPAEVRGNITCDTNPDEVVLGYVSVSTVTTNSGYYRDDDYDFFIETEKCGEVRMGDTDYLGHYYSGYLPYGVDMGAVYWARTRCVDCEYYGGSVNAKPEDWPE